MVKKGSMDIWGIVMVVYKGNSGDSFWIVNWVIIW